MKITAENQEAFKLIRQHITTPIAVGEALAARYPYQRAYLPVNRLQHDGTLWNW